MNITVVSGPIRVDIRIKGHDHETLAKAEQAATRLLAACPTPPADPPVPAFGFSLSADATLSGQPFGEHDAE